MKIKTSELTGSALDWAVANIEWRGSEADRRRGVEEIAYTLHYSTNWSQGGPIIEREKIDIENTNWVPKVAYAKFAGDEPYGSSRTEGPTPLVAAMRCFVASKLGDEVEIPEELL